MGTEAFKEGCEAGKRGDSPLRNPYRKTRTQEHDSWMAGWDDGIKVHRAQPRGTGLEFRALNGRRKGMDTFIK